ncbi:MAG: hypothetical protein JO222_02195 [Frankiales bacterium]|nr:hypothetical protein [Frankiales bacterium]
MSRARLAAVVAAVLMAATSAAGPAMVGTAHNGGPTVLPSPTSLLQGVPGCC